MLTSALSKSASATAALASDVWTSVFHSAVQAADRVLGHIAKSNRRVEEDVVEATIAIEV